MHFTRNGLIVAVLCLGLGGASVMANDVRPARDKVAPAAAEAPENDIQIAPLMGGVAQGQGQITITATAAGPAGCVLVDANGLKQVQNEEYGKKVKITDDPQNGIKIEYTRRKGGTDETKNYEAKNAKELEKKHPEGFKLYQQYMGNQLAGQAGAVTIVQAGGMALPVPGQPLPGGMLQAIPAMPGQIQVLPAGGAGMPIEVATAMMGQLRSDIKSAAKSGAWKDATKETKAALKKEAQELKKQLSDMEKQFEEK